MGVSQYTRYQQVLSLQVPVKKCYWHIPKPDVHRSRTFLVTTTNNNIEMLNENENKNIDKKNRTKSKQY